LRILGTLVGFAVPLAVDPLADAGNEVRRATADPVPKPVGDLEPLLYSLPDTSSRSLVGDDDHPLGLGEPTNHQLM
jgi:hypothetical protein